MGIARERTIVKLSLVALTQFLDYLLFTRYSADGLSLEERFANADDALRTFNLLVLSFKYLQDLNQIAFLTNRIFNIIIRKQRKLIPETSIGNIFVGSWIVGLDNENLRDFVSNGHILFDYRLYRYILYPTARALDALSLSKGVSTATIIRGVTFLEKVFSNMDCEGTEEMAPELLVPIMDALYNIYASDVLPYEKVQSQLLPLAEMIVNCGLLNDPDRETIYTRDMLLKLKLMKGRGLDQDDAQYIGQLLSFPILKNVLKALHWLLKFNVEIPPMIPELLMDLLIENFGLVFDIHKNDLLMYYISNAETVSEILTEYSDKKFAQIVLDRTVEYVAESVLQGIDNIYSAVKLLLIAKILIEARAIIRR